MNLHDEGCLFPDKDTHFGWFVKERFRLDESAEELLIYGWSGCGNAVERQQDIEGSCAAGNGKRLCACETRETVSFEAERIKDGTQKACELAAKGDKIIVALGCNSGINSKEKID